MPKLKLVKYHPLFAYSVGDVFQVSEKDTKTLLSGGYAVPVQPEKTEEATDKEAKSALKEAKDRSTRK